MFKKSIFTAVVILGGLYYYNFSKEGEDLANVQENLQRSYQSVQELTSLFSDFKNDLLSTTEKAEKIVADVKIKANELQSVVKKERVVKPVAYPKTAEELVITMCNLMKENDFSQAKRYILDGNYQRLSMVFGMVDSRWIGEANCNATMEVEQSHEKMKKITLGDTSVMFLEKVGPQWKVADIW